MGMGGIGRELKKRAEALGMRVQYHNRSELGKELAAGARYVGFGELLGTSDVISLNLPLNVRFLSGHFQFTTYIYAFPPPLFLRYQTNLPAIPQPTTHHLLSTREFALMKPGVVIINTARGAIIDEEALVAALASGQVFSCGLDVYEDEPRVHPGLVGNGRVVLLPHLGTWSVEVRWDFIFLWEGGFLGDFLCWGSFEGSF